SRQRAMTFSSPSGASARTERSGGGGSRMIFAAMSAVVSPVYGGSPVSKANRIVPMDQMSARASTARVDRSCSGDMNAGVPIAVLHHDVRRAVVEATGVEDAHDVVALDLDRRLGLANEARDGVGGRRAVGEEELHGHGLVELRVRRGDDDAHAADAEHALDA